MNPRDLSIDAYDYPLPDERIAKHPLAKRDACRLLCYKAGTGELRDAVFSELPGLLPAGCLMVANNTRVINARLRMHKPATGARIEIFCLEPAVPADYESSFGARGNCSWNCLVGNSKKWKEGSLTEVYTMTDGRTVELTALRGADSGVVEFSWIPADLSFSEVIGAAGEIPIPPYLNRESEASDATDYQTVFSHIEGSVAAPTAGLHFTPELLEAIDAAGIERDEVTLHVGAGTFRPVKTDTIGEHDMHSEFICVRRDFIARLAAQVEQGRPVVAVGTTSVRTLESLYHIGRLMLDGRWDGEVQQWAAYEPDADKYSPAEALQAIVRSLDDSGESALVARTRIIIAPSYRYMIVDGMVTNFHQPKSTLLLLVSAFLGDDRWRTVYDHALASPYRFLSYGDACLFFR